MPEQSEAEKIYWANRYIEEGGERPTLRYRFAMAALAGFMTNPIGLGSTSDVAECAYVYADAMLAARVKPVPAKEDAA